MRPLPLQMLFMGLTAFATSEDGPDAFEQRDLARERMWERERQRLQTAQAAQHAQAKATRCGGAPDQAAARRLRQRERDRK
jgi:hypothetical protein